jgi:hypothetical protein
MAAPHKIDDYRMPKLDRFEAPDRFDELDKIFKKAEKEGVVAALPEAEKEVRLTELNESRICTIRTRLYLLGYLKRDNHTPKIGDKFKSAVHRFQIEAGLEPDSWVGRQTWTALQELVSFEHPSHLEKWFAAKPLKPALLRAIKLRLFVLGFLPSKQAQDMHKLHTALEKFVAVARILNLHDQPLLPRPVFNTISVLFDQDGLAGQLGTTGKHFMKHRPADIGEKAARRLIRKFTICSAKIELWLLGYDLALDGSAKFDTPGGSEIHSYLPARYPLFHALFSFWRDNGKGKQEARKRADRVSGSFFARLLQMQRDGDRPADTNQSDQLFEVLSKEKQKVLDRVWGQIKTIGSRIWDGLKRVWRWLKSIITRTLKKIGSWAKNIARLAYQYALNAFPVVRKLIKIAKETASFLTHKTLKDSNVACIVINRDNDYDYRLFINSDPDRGGMKALLTKFYSTAYYFSIGMQVLGIIGSALITVIKNIPFGGGWFGLILALLKIYSSLKNFSDILDEERAFMATV